jgi:adenylate kinase
VRLLLLGGPGGGKGTQGARLAERLGVEHVAAGDALRAEVARGSEIGTRVAGYLDVGELVPDDVVVDLMTPIVAAAARAGGYILDGFPRNLAQARVADDAWEHRGIGLDAVVYLEVPEPELRRRLLERAHTEGRSDDTPEVIANRLALFAETTFPLVEHYRDRGLLVAIAADRAPDAVTDDVLSRLSDRPRTMEQR